MKKILIIASLFLLSCQANQTIKKDSKEDKIKSNQIKMKVTLGDLTIKKKK